MSDQEAVVEEIAEEAMEEAVEKAEGGNADPLESLAREHGWKSEDEWKGKPPKDGFKSAEEFVRSTFEIQQRQAEKIDRIEHNLNKMAEGEAKRMRSALEAQERRLLEQRQEAVEIGDTAAFNRVDEELNKTREELKGVQDSPEAQRVLKAEQEFMDRNPWYGKNIGMTADIETVAQQLAQKNLEPDAFFTELEKIAKARYPEEFTNPNREKSGAVAGDSPRSKSSKSKTFDSLPPEAQAAYEEVAMYTKMSKDKYAKSYYGE